MATKKSRVIHWRTGGDTTGTGKKKAGVRWNAGLSFRGFRFWRRRESYCNTVGDAAGEGGAGEAGPHGSGSFLACGGGARFGILAWNFNRSAEKISVTSELSGILARFVEATTAAGAVTIFAFVQKKLPNGAMSCKWSEYRRFSRRLSRRAGFPLQICKSTPNTGTGYWLRNSLNIERSFDCAMSRGGGTVIAYTESIAT
ncbi:hypothetical protein [Geomonas agri]|uniref:hypothetical protein n=1 Tax=Geomonas agri TaxID=2873702 RepID=UPI001CD362C7|nr:hypothetical protein [Geomonas agri]